MTHLPLTTVTFPEIALRTRDAHKLRGYFGNVASLHCNGATAATMLQQRCYGAAMLRGSNRVSVIGDNMYQ